MCRSDRHNSLCQLSRRKVLRQSAALRISARGRDHKHPDRPCDPYD